jgi:small multidrug resistance pump
MLLAIAIVFELLADVLLKYTEGFTVLWASVLTLVMYLVCFFCFARALTKLNLSVAYAVWSGVGIAFLTVMSVVLFHQPLTTGNVVGIALITIGILIMDIFGTNLEDSEAVEDPKRVES